MKDVDDTLVVMIQRCVLGLLTITVTPEKNMDRGKEKEDIFVWETLLVL